MPKPAYRIYATLLDAFAWYKASEDEGALQEFIDKINRVRTPPTDPQLRGIAFEELVDDVASGYLNLGNLEVVNVHDTTCPSHIIHGFADAFRGAVRQVNVEVSVETLAGDVIIYGKVDEIVMDTAYDIKTTAKYEFPKYLHKFQHLVYLEALRKDGISRFVYAITDFRNTFMEEYSWTQDGRDRMVAEVAHLVEFLEIHRDRITDRKVFGLDPVAASK